MCGIAGLIGTSWSAAQFESMFESIRHRGPDGAGVHATTGLELGMNRLRIRGPERPLPVRSAGAVVAFNGQIYAAGDDPFSLVEVTDGLENEIAAVRSSRGYVDGMYACALADMEQATVLLTTDAQFIKPLFYSESSAGVAFCSEIAPLLRLSGPRQVNREALAELFAYGWYLRDRSCADSVHLVHHNDILIRSGTVERRPKPQARQIPDVLPTPERIRKAIAKSVRRCLGGSGQFGLAVSGGLDSTILAWEANAAGVEGLITISVGSAGEDDGLDSLEQLGFPRGGAWETWKHRKVTIESDDDFLSELESSTALFAQPTTMSSLPLYRRLAAAAAEEGVRVLLTGEGVDELFCGYSSYAKVRGGGPLLDYYRNAARERLVRDLFPEDVLARVRRRFTEVYGAHADLRPIERDLRLTRLLLRTDVCLMSVSVEGRTPFLHNGIPEMALAIPWDDLASAPGKGVLRRAYRSAIGARADVVKTRFKASDALLKRCIAEPRVAERIVAGASPVLGERGTRGCVAALQTDAGFDADVCCLVLTLAFLVERGILR